MPAAREIRQSGRRPAALLAALLLVSSCAWGQAASPLAERLAEIREINRFVPEKALPMLRAIEAQARDASVDDKGELLAQLCMAHSYLGKYDEALAACDELVNLGRSENNNAALAKGLLRKGYIKYNLNELARSHELIWEAERLANTTDDVDLRMRAGISSAEAHAESGNLPRALEGMQAIVTWTRQHGDKTQLVVALNSLARLYATTREYGKGFEALDEAMALAAQTVSPGRLALLKATEYRLAVASGQMGRALKAQLAELALQRQLGAHSAVPWSLVNLSDCYLKLRDHGRALAYGLQALEAARAINNENLVAVARVNIGQAHLAAGRVLEGKRSVEQGLAIFDKLGDKPQLQALLFEYGDALEGAGDYAGAIAAYHRERGLSNELFEKRRQKAMLELQEKYDADRKQRQIELLQRENQVKSVEIDNRRLQQRVWWLLAVVFALASVVVGLLYRKVRQANAQLYRKNLELKQQSVRDPLTGLYNRRHFQEFMRGDPAPGQLADQRGAGTSGEQMVSALFLLDVDHFKHINDTWGHGAGDAVLIKIADSLREILRETDMIVRWGGEEFLAFLPAIPKSGLDEVARRLLSGIAATEVEYQGARLSANVSVGFAPFPLSPGGEPLSWERTVNLVDMALYMAKGHGRNRAYGVTGFAQFERTSMEEIEQNLEQAWREGFVQMSIVTAGFPELRASA
ncbi:tetratricopeptide repeat-containing diguanylate cyclase [Massilia sp. GCM10023247]|uniref:tetratricopeptide repeat-containing diguanylate cyclase n=1 Tax=Massilia sp. GCM10023247 TaxID=3252643 RepID=UPI00361BC3FA